MKQMIQLHPAMGQQVLDHLKQYADLPEVTAESCSEVYVAGQSVASAVSELFGNGEAVVYNDIDAFVMLGEFNPAVYDKSYESKHSSFLMRMDHQELSVAMEYGQLRLDGHDVYSMLATRRQGMLNEIVCGGAEYRGSPLNEGHANSRTLKFLKTFDLNCVQVGVRMSDKALVWTPAFDRFLQTKELLIESDKTPVHTAIRWFKKKSELEGVYGHDDKAMELLATSILSINAYFDKFQQSEPPLLESYSKSVPRTLHTRYIRSVAARLVFAKEYRKRYENVSSEVSRYFEISSLENTLIPLNTLKARANPDVDLDLLLRLPTALVPTYVRAKQGFWKKHTSRRILDILASTKTNKKGTGAYRMVAVAQAGVDHFSSQGSDKALEKVVDAMEGHSGIVAIASRGTPYPVVEAVSTALHGLAKEGKAYGYGFLDANPHKMMSTLVDLPIQDVSAAVTKFVQDEYSAAIELRNNAKFLIQAEFKPFRFKGFSISELRDPGKILEEGDVMHHCVGGYLGAVYGGKSAIVSFFKHRVQDRLTLEVSPNGRRFFGTRLFRSVQLRGLLNRAPTPEEELAAEEFVLGLNVRRLSRGLLSAEAACKLAAKLPAPIKKWASADPHGRWKLSYRKRAVNRFYSFCSFLLRKTTGYSRPDLVRRTGEFAVVSFYSSDFKPLKWASLLLGLTSTAVVSAITFSSTEVAKKKLDEALEKYNLFGKDEYSEKYGDPVFLDDFDIPF